MLVPWVMGIIREYHQHFLTGTKLDDAGKCTNQDARKDPALDNSE